MSNFNSNLQFKKSQSMTNLNSGFFLLETLFALLLISTFSAILGFWFLRICNNNISMVNNIKALTYCCDIFEKIKAYKKADINLDFLKKDNFTASINLKPDPKISNLAFITVTVFDNNRRNKVSLSTEVYIK